LGGRIAYCQVGSTVRFPATNAGLTKDLLIELADVQILFCLGILVKVLV
jgi:hypothetical protein